MRRLGDRSRAGGWGWWWNDRREWYSRRSRPGAGELHRILPQEDAGVRLRAVCLGLLGVIALGMAAHAGDSAALEQARRAMAESLPQLAIGKLKHLLADPALDASTRADVTRLLAEAYLGTGQASDA